MQSLGKIIRPTEYLILEEDETYALQGSSDGARLERYGLNH